MCDNEFKGGVDEQDKGGFVAWSRCVSPLGKFLFSTRRRFETLEDATAYVQNEHQRCCSKK